jgi:hypothetical protein
MRREFLPVGAFRVVLQLCAAEFCLCKGRSGEEHRLLLSSEECSCCRGRAAAADGLLFLPYMGLVEEVGDESLGELLGLSVNAFNVELMISMGRKHCASGLNVVVTSRSALLSSGESCFCSE